MERKKERDLLAAQEESEIKVQSAKKGKKNSKKEIVHMKISNFSCRLLNPILFQYIRSEKPPGTSSSAKHGFKKGMQFYKRTSLSLVFKHGTGGSHQI